MRKMFNCLLVVFILALMTVAIDPGAARAAPNPQGLPVDDALKAAFQSAVEANRLQVAGFLLYNVEVYQIQYSQDLSLALLWVRMIDQQTGQVVATEPGLSIAHIRPGSDPANPDNWLITLQNASDYASQLAALPPELLTDDVRAIYLPSASVMTVQPPGGNTYTGYKLPWAAGLKKYVTNSIGHIYTVSGGWTSCPTTCRYAFDFADGSMFPVLAAKGGTVKAYRITCQNNDHNCANYLVLEDQSTSPTTYQIYYHLMAESIPQRLRTLGTQVVQGDYIANADNTGPSTGSHLHIHVYESPTGANWSWGISRDFVFDEVKDNGGRPRTCAEAHELPQYGKDCSPGDLYTSANIPAHLPSGAVSSPANQTILTQQDMLVGGYGTGGEGVVLAQVLANWNGAWTTLDSINIDSSGVFLKDIDLCAANIPDGPFDLMVKIFDRAGGQAVASPGVLHLAHTVACNGGQPPPPPACQPSANQVALYTLPDFQGTCTRLDARVTAYGPSELGAVGDNRVASIQTGANVRAVLYDLGDDPGKPVPLGRIETVWLDDANLADNRIGSGHVSAVLSEMYTYGPDEPFLTKPGLRWDGTGLTNLDSVVLAWTGGASATSFDVNLAGPGVNQSWTTVRRGMSVSAGTLPAGSYTWSVTSRNSQGTNQTTQSFNVALAAFQTATVRTTPFVDNMESGVNGWTATGLWRLGPVKVADQITPSNAWLYTGSAGYGDATYRGGDLTSAPIQLPAGSASYLSFKYYAVTEDGNPWWDQRQVQIIDNATGRTTDLYTLSDDKELPDQLWINSPPLSLGSFAGKTIRVRFHFDTVDKAFNAYAGWFIDDLKVDGNGPATGCPGMGISTPATAQTLTIGTVVTNAMICPQGDVDYYKFDGLAGQSLQIKVDAQSKTPPSTLDSQVFLIDADQTSVIAWNDDQTPGVIKDSLLEYTLLRSGTYYIKVKAWDYPAAGGLKSFYDLHLTQLPMTTPRLVKILFPSNPAHVPIMPLDVQVQAEDYNGGPVAKVEFYILGPNSAPGGWVKVGTDDNGSDGWSYLIDPVQYGGVTGASIYVQAINFTGGVIGTALWNMVGDANFPSSQLHALPAKTNSTYIGLTWSAMDGGNDIDHFDIQYQENSGGGFGDWQNWAIHPAGNARSAWFSGVPGHSYTFEIRAVDARGNIENYEINPAATTTLSATCTGDAYEPADNTQANAILLKLGQYQAHNFCKDDVDWVFFQAPGSNFFMVGLYSLNGGAAFAVNVYNSSQVKVASFQSGGPGLSAFHDWAYLNAGTYLLEIRPLQTDLYGTDVSYWVMAERKTVIILPMINR